MNSKRADAGAAVAGLFSNSSATGGLARRVPEPSAHVSLAPVDRTQRLRQGVELDEHRRLTNRT